ncbi:major facilitator superfamily domain-containing protein [Pilobolus umbonatus]|nr:major facilitator superfamily domain-containing protein [Pilobolus umbonatus]
MSQSIQNSEEAYISSLSNSTVISAYAHDDTQDSAEASILASSTSLRGRATIKGSNNIIKTIFLTLCLAGLQFTWTVEMAYGTPYLLSLGLSKSHMSLVWIAGPLSGLIMQPVVGIISDECRSKWGRRRPFMVGGSALVVLCLIIIGWTKEIAGLFTIDEDTLTTIAIGIAIGSIYLLDFSINCVQASCRALIVDSLPPSLQEQGTAWAGKMVGLGNVVGYFMGYVDLVKIFPFLGNTQLKVLCLFAAFFLLLCLSITCYTVSERVFSDGSYKKKSSPLTLFSDIFRNIWHLPKPIQQICNVQFFSWIGWFPFLFYSTTWVAEIYTRNIDEDTVIEDRVGQATRAGSFAFLVYSIVSLLSSFVFPMLITPSLPDDNGDPSNDKSDIQRMKCMEIPHLTLPRAWTISHFIFCICMTSTLFVFDVSGAAVVIGVCGISWAISMWAPFSLIGEYVSKQELNHMDDTPQQTSVFGQPHMMMSSFSLSGMGLGNEGMYQPLPRANEEEVLEMSGLNGLDDEDTLIEDSRRGNSMDVKEIDPSHGTPAAGILLGIHNMYIVLPQFLVTFLSSIVFRIIEKGNLSIDAIGFILRFGAVMAGIAGLISLKIKDM